MKRNSKKERLVFTEHPEDRRIRLEATAEAEKTIGPFWRDHWERFVALVQTYGDVKAHDLLDSLREDFWGARHLPHGDPPQGAK